MYQCTWHSQRMYCYSVLKFILIFSLVVSSGLELERETAELWLYQIVIWSVSLYHVLSTSVSVPIVSVISFSLRIVINLHTSHHPVLLMLMLLPFVTNPMVRCNCFNCIHNQQLNYVPCNQPHPLILLIFEYWTF